ncbi:MAG: hypothetical protein Q4C13_00265 [Clostridia bacterium]|nr:hypothetical protein [Clostridia bacterium]
MPKPKEPADMQNIHENLYQFTAYIPEMDFNIHQYLLAAEPAIAFAAGTQGAAEKNLPAILSVLRGRPLKYIFVSHMESDECGGLSALLRAYPEACVLCSPLCARELPGFGFGGRIRPCRGGDILEDGGLRLRFFDYPSEVHLQDGLLCFEEGSGVFYSADLMRQMGDGAGRLRDGGWQTEVANIGLASVPSKSRLQRLQKTLLEVSPRFIAVGHGFCVALQRAERAQAADVFPFQSGQDTV